MSFCKLYINIFFLGLTNYLRKHKFGNAVTGDLWQAISEAWNGTQRNFSIPEMMDSWTLNMGYPIVIFEQQNTTNIYTISQERFLKASNVRISLYNYYTNSIVIFSFFEESNLLKVRSPIIFQFY